jgi:hypothetical protein
MIKSREERTMDKVDRMAQAVLWSALMLLLATVAILAGSILLHADIPAFPQLSPQGAIGVTVMLRGVLAAISKPRSTEATK